MTFYLVLVSVIMKLFIHSTNIYQELHLFLASFHVQGIQQQRKLLIKSLIGEGETKDKNHMNNYIYNSKSIVDRC